MLYDTIDGEIKNQLTATHQALTHTRPGDIAMTRNKMLVTAIALSIAVLVFLATRGGASSPGVTGAIVAVDGAVPRIRVIDNTNIEYWFHCTERTTLTLNGFAASFNQLAAGQRVDVQYEPDTYIASQVDAKSP